MPQYRLELLDPRGARRQTLLISCVSDEDALLVASAKARGRAVNVWENARLVGDLSARTEVAPWRNTDGEER